MTDLQLPLPIYTEIPIDTVLSKDGQEFTLTIGLDEEHIGQLKQYSLDETDAEIQSHTSDRQRFGEGSYEEWYAKERTPFALVHKETGALAALAWFGPKPLGRKSLRFLSEEELQKENIQEKGDWHTIVYRSYRPFRGRGIMRDFLQKALSVYLAHYPEAKLWAGVSTENAASAALAEKLGFKPDFVDTEKRWMTMIKE